MLAPHALDEAWAEALVGAGFEVRLAAEVASLGGSAVVIGAGPLGKLDDIRRAAPRATVLWVTDDAGQALDAGVDDALGAKATAGELVARVRRRFVARGLEGDARRSVEVVLELTRSLASTLELRRVLHLVLRRLADIIDVDRASVVVGTPEEGDAWVMAASDDEMLRDLPIDLEHYPELSRVLRTGEPLFVEDVEEHPLLQLPEVTMPQRFRALTLFPIQFEERAVGVLFLRFRHPRILGPDERFALEAVANATGIALRNASLVERVREQSQERADQRARDREALRRYIDFFESCADGIIVLDRDGEVAFANPAVQAITGRPADELARRQWTEMLAPDSDDLLGSLRSDLERGRYPVTDVDAIRADGERRTLSVSFSPLHDARGLIVTLRDVTRERETARELVETKEFFQRVIDASVDAIVAADMRGNVQLFNPAAERIYGWPVDEVVGVRNVAELYPEGEAREIMRQIRSPERGGEGALEGYETRLLHRDGSLIPVTLSAALLDVRGAPVGTVGIFRDLRATRAIEAQLEKTRDELAEKEQKAFIVELAGATAHELNQPLTSILGYAGLLERHVEDPRLERATGVIVREAERMAEIVRKIGRLTKFESKPYVGDTRILDLEAAVDSERNPTS